MTNDDNLNHEIHCQTQFIRRNAIFSIAKFNKTRQDFAGKTKLLSKFGINKFHRSLPFLKEEIGKFVYWDLYSSIIYSHLSKEERDAIKHEYREYFDNILGQDIIRNYSVISPVVIKKLNDCVNNNFKL